MTLFLAGITLLAVGAPLVLVVRVASPRIARIMYQVAVLAGCGLVGSAAARALAGVPMHLTVPATTPGGPWHIGIDALSAIFLLVVAAVGAACAVFGIHDEAREPHAPRIASLAFPVLVAAIAMVLAGHDIVTFLGAWELMAISSYVLIVAHHREASVRRAGLIYLIATHTATLLLFAMFGVWSARATDWSFAALAIATPSLSTGSVAMILTCALFGFGVKAGSVPFHFWLPPAHSAAPSHVSALMSGVVIKTGVYGLLRVLLLLGGAPAWWGWLVFAIGVGSAVLGVLWALVQHDFKRLLAYHSVENIGIIFMGIGIGVLGASRGAAAVAALGFAGGLLHTVNHALFKSLLFLGAGVVYRATGTRNLEELGGLAGRLPLTWIGFVIGAAAIVGLPPFNGFVSEWLVYQGMFASADTGGIMRSMLFGIVCLALVGALALACFAKVSGVAFLGTARSTAAAGAQEESGGTWVPILALAAACVLLGVVPMLGVQLVQPAIAGLPGLQTTDGSAIPTSILAGARTISRVAFGSVVVTAALWWTRGRLLRRHGARCDVTWACGYDAVTPRMQYTASSFAAPLVSQFGHLSGVRTERRDAAVHTAADDLVLDRGLLPLWAMTERIAVRFRATHHGRLHLYLLYVMAALVFLLGYLALAGSWLGGEATR